MPKFSKAPKIIIMCRLLPIKWNHRVLPWCVVKMKCLLEELGYLQRHLVIGWSHLILCDHRVEYLE